MQIKVRYFARRKNDNVAVAQSQNQAWFQETEFTAFTVRGDNNNKTDVFVIGIPVNLSRNVDIKDVACGEK